MDNKFNVVDSYRAERSTTGARHENKFSNWAKAVQLSVLELVGRWHISGNDEIQHRHPKLRSTFQHSLTGQDHEPIESAA